MKRRIFWSIFLTALITLGLGTTLTISLIHNSIAIVKKEELAASAATLSEALAYSEVDIDYLRAVGRQSGSRITLIDHSGKVVYDSFAPAETLENHLDRPEVEAALQEGTGESERLSETLKEKTFYYARQLKDGRILRLSGTSASVFGVINEMIPFLAIALLLVLCIALFAAGMLTKTLVTPLRAIDLDHPLSNDTYDELAPLLVRMERQNEKITEHLSHLHHKQQQFDTITENMEEGLIVFDEHGNILSKNRMARELFPLSAETESYLALCRDQSYLRTMSKAFAGKKGNSLLQRNGRVYQLAASPVVTQSETSCAAVLFVIDVTEKEEREAMRREFSANVSHELKTPLTSILGSAEIIEKGIAKIEDIPIFAAQIHAEATRLLTLIEDIIGLSQLDESTELPEFESLDLYELCEDCLNHLQGKADKLEVKLELKGTHQMVEGVPRILHELVYNLCDNAITYNKIGGKVMVSVEEKENHILLAVEDTGIGILPEHQERVFERFYRVDKSHSKEMGGTGLGLSIVKHAALCHSAQLQLQSTPNVGTKITVTF